MNKSHFAFLLKITYTTGLNFKSTYMGLAEIVHQYQFDRFCLYIHPYEMVYVLYIEESCFRVILQSNILHRAAPSQKNMMEVVLLMPLSGLCQTIVLLLSLTVT